MGFLSRIGLLVGRALSPPPDAVPGGLSEAERAKSRAVYAACLTAFIGCLFGVQAAVAFAMGHKSFESLPFFWQCVSAGLAAGLPYWLDRCRRLQDGVQNNEDQRSDDGQPQDDGASSC